MEIILRYIGKSNVEWIKKGIEEYAKRIPHYVKFTINELADIKKNSGFSQIQIKEMEGKLFLNDISGSDFVVLLDERGAQATSQEFAKWIEKRLNSSFKRLVFIIGGPFGFSENLYKRADYKISLSKMTFTHDMARLFFVEQLYRAFTIIRGESYHHE